MRTRDYSNMHVGEGGLNDPEKFQAALDSIDVETVAVVKAIVREEVKAINDAQVMHIEEATSNTNKSRDIEGVLLQGEIVPDRYLSITQKGRTIRSGHRGDRVDIEAVNGNFYYNVSIVGGVEDTIPFGAGQKFVIRFADNAAENKEYGLDGASNLYAMPLKQNRYTNVFNEVLSTYTPGSRRGLERLKNLPFCNDVPSISDIRNNTIKPLPGMRSFAANKTPQEIDDEYADSLRERLGLTEDEEFPKQSQLEAIAKKEPKIFEDANTDARSTGDRANLTITKDGIAMAMPQSKSRMTMTDGGIALKGKVDTDSKLQKPMDPIGISSVENPMDLMPAGNVMICHNKKNPSIEELITLGLISVRLIVTTIQMGKIMRDIIKVKQG